MIRQASTRASTKASKMDHARAEELLPWLVNGTLDERERVLVSLHVDGCTECQRAVRDLEHLQKHIRAEPATPLVPEPDVGALMSRLDAAGGRRPPAAWAAAAAVAFVVSAVAFVTLQDDATGPQRFETATSSGGSAQAASMDYIIDVTFEAGSHVDTHADVIGTLGGDVVERGESGTYRIVVQLPAASMEELARYVRDVESMESVQAAEVVAVQLPVTRELDD